LKLRAYEVFLFITMVNKYSLVNKSIEKLRVKTYDGNR